MTYDTILEAVAQALADDHEKRTGTKLHRALFKDTAATAISAYISTLSPDVSGLVERLKETADVCRAHELNEIWIEDLEEAADALTALSLQLAAERKRVEVLTHAIEQLHGPLSVASLTARAETAEASLTLAQEENERLRKALEWYEDQASAMARYSIQVKPEAMMAIVTSMSLDAGQRARAALSTTSKGKDKTDAE